MRPRGSGLLIAIGRARHKLRDEEPEASMADADEDSEEPSEEEREAMQALIDAAKAGDVDEAIGAFRSLCAVSEDD